ncbi:Shikimate 5-dehydrogenase I alpha [Alkalibacterium sp. AK22]|uniref:shikimate dehydrogenase n=1 Tax=Alkalibacterium sp. AK22 TaxID=1229520 RepID=UPI00044A15D7|nr:shikimate dehydrogenase [Alkalibacterium sp. AK22]EXJ22699.1 Shikimate 5-dehydrogenase I alpha [Alkalibacterium sp. AK22]
MKFYGLFGEKLTHSLSPQLHKEIYKRAGINAAYKTFPFPPDQLHQAVNSLKILSISGTNVTIPYKKAVMPFLDKIDPVAQKLGVVNTIANKDGKLTGYNTDYDGFDLLFKRRSWSVQDKDVTVLGTGGSSQMVVAYLKDHGARSITLVSRSVKEAVEDERLRYLTYEDSAEISGHFLINTTPVGMYPNADSCPVDPAVISRFDALIDLIYNPMETVFLKEARERGKPGVNGLEMLIGQAVRAAEIWEDQTFPEELTDSLIKDYEQWKGA